MASKNKIEVIIGGRIYTLVGYESEKYMQRIALYIDKKMQELQGSESAKKLGAHLISILTSINVADDLFKLTERYNEIVDKNEELTKLINQYKDQLNDSKEELELYKDEFGKIENENLEYAKLIEQNQLELLRYKEELKKYKK